MNLPLLTIGSTGLDVVTAQRLLTKAGFFAADDGDFGRQTETATKLFQRAKGLTDDGKIGKNTWAALMTEKPVVAPQTKPIPAIASPREVIKEVPVELDRPIKDHWLTSAIREPIAGGDKLEPLFLVIHFTAGATAKSSIDFWRTPAAKGASAQIVIDRDGTIYQCRPFNKTCGHAGVSSWKGHKNLNDCSIGIELANAGDDEKLAARYTELPLVSAKHKNGTKVVKWEAYPEAQLQALEGLSKLLVKEYALTDIVGHDDIAPKRKNDPGPAFPMAELKKACGFDA